MAKMTQSFKPPNYIEMIVFDMAGTTVTDTINGLPLVTHAIRLTFEQFDKYVNADEMNEMRGMNKRKVIENFKQKYRIDQSVDDLYILFNKHLDSAVKVINTEIEGTTKLFSLLKSKSIKIVVESGFNSTIVNQIIRNLKWNNLIDFVLYEVARPSPEPIKCVMSHFNISNPTKVIKVGDSILDIEEGKNVGCHTIGVLTGTQTREQLMSANPDAVINSVTGMLEWFV